MSLEAIIGRRFNDVTVIESCGFASNCVIHWESFAVGKLQIDFSSIRDNIIKKTYQPYF